MRIRIVPILVAVVVAIGGCTGDNGADAAPSSTGASSSTTTSPPDRRPTNAPEVTDPIDLHPFYAKPCATLTAEQQRQVGFNHYDPVDHESSNRQFAVCVWRHNPQPATGANYGYRLMLHVSGDPLAEAYGASGTWSVFEPRQVRGLPAIVRSLSTPDDQCEVIVGTGNGQGITISGTIAASDPTLCDRFTTAAEWVIDAVRG
jgi:Protein of unknown function (DUF3558)